MFPLQKMLFSLFVSWALGDVFIDISWPLDSKCLEDFTRLALRTVKNISKECLKERDSWSILGR